mgnify:CR=1 FL=1
MTNGKCMEWLLNTADTADALAARDNITTAEHDELVSAYRMVWEAVDGMDATLANSVIDSLENAMRKHAPWDVRQLIELEEVAE